MAQYHLTRVSNNKKTGAIPVSTTSADSCPDVCGLKEVCYASTGPLALHWRAVTEGDRGYELDQFASELRTLPTGQVWRHNQAGDLEHRKGRIVLASIVTIVQANNARKLRGFTYTHHELTEHNVYCITFANAHGFVINVSTDNINDAVRVYNKYKLPTVTLLPMDAPNVQEVQGVKVVACPAEKTPRVTCANCTMCMSRDRKYVIGFRAHGTYKRAAEIIAKG